MSKAEDILAGIIDDFLPDKFGRFFREKSTKFVPKDEDLSRYDDADFKSGLKLGEIGFSSDDQLIICAFEVQKELSERAGKKAQYDKAKRILKDMPAFSAGIFIFYDQNGNFRFSLIYPEAIGTKRQWSHFKRFTYFVSPEFTNKTFLKQIGVKEFTDLAALKEAFSITAVTDLFYNEFFKIYDSLVSAAKKTNKIGDEEKARDFILLFVIRTIFLGFIQKKEWLGADLKFVQNFFTEYKARFFDQDKFYSRWLKPLFFEALNSPQGRKVAYSNNDFSQKTEGTLQMAPYLNGGLFEEKLGYDTEGWIIPDQEIEGFFDFLFSYSFTIEENSLEDEDLQLNPEFLGIIFERLVNKADGAVYTPRTEVDLMCRLSLVKWLEKNLNNSVKDEEIYELFFKESEVADEQRAGSFSRKEAEEILDKLSSLVICDPAVGSGAFLVGMMQVIDEIEQSLRERFGLEAVGLFERKKQIIKDSLYGVEVKEWAVWICQLRLWLSLFVDAPETLKDSYEPILPSLEFKVRKGDSLVQRLGSVTFPVMGHAFGASVSASTKTKVTTLKKLKSEYFNNSRSVVSKTIEAKELEIYREILTSEILEKRKQIISLEEVEAAIPLSLFGDEKPVVKQKSYKLNQDKVERIQSEIEELEAQKRALKEDKPLVWSIEFAEVFIEKEGFDIVIGNPPYVRQEEITDPTGRVLDKRQYKDYLTEMVRLDFPAYFTSKRKINAQSDIYAYFYIRGLKLLNSGGIHTFICSNSWLDVGYGAWLQEFLLEKCQIDLIIDNHSKRSFKAADVNTIISIIEAPKATADMDHLAKFVAFKKPFEEVVFTENLLQIKEADKIVSSEAFRVYPITQAELKEAGSEYESDEQTALGAGRYVGDKWGGKYLRAPDIFFTILKKGEGKLVKLGDIVEVKRGFTTGANKFFYLTEDDIARWKIEAEFLKPVIKSPKECKSILIDPKDLKYKIFMCNKSKGELKGTNALKYIEWGERQGFHKRPSCSGRRYWYGLGERKKTDAVWVKSVNENHSQAVIMFDAYVDQRLYEISLYDSGLISKLSGIVNSSVMYLMKELFGRANLGEGVLDSTVYEAQKTLIYNPKLLTSINKQSKLISSTIFEEYGIDPKSSIPIEEQEPKPLPDRAALDKVVFDALDLTDEERKDVYRAVCRLVWNRISKAKSI